jgi:protein SCO1/2
MRVRASKWRLPGLAVFAVLGVAMAAGFVVSRSVHSPKPPSPALRLNDLTPGTPPADFRLTDFNGQVRTLQDYRGQVLVLFFGFTRCPNVCPTELFKIAQVMKRLGPASDRVQVLFITLDPERDSPELMKTYVTAFDPRFVGLTGTPDQIDAVADNYHVLHIKEAVGNDYSIGHSAGAYVIDRQRQHRLVGTLDTTIDDLTHDLRILTQ